MHFFEKQRVDAAGILGVKLQKALIFLGIVTFSTFFFGAFLPSIISLLILAIGFSGAYRRRPCLLAMYFWINVIMAIVGLAVLIGMLVVSSQTSVAQSNDYSNEAVAVNPITPTPNIPTNATESPSSESYDYDSSSTIMYAYSSYSEFNAIIIIVLILCVILSVLVSFFKVYSIVLAFKMARLLRQSPTLPVCSSSKSSGCGSNPTYPAAAYSALPSTPVELETSVAIPENNVVDNLAAQGQVQMMYMPYPYMGNNQNGGMMVNQYGQPVFYTFSPNTQTPQ
jgi:flagellar basal body-associated protein FliL